MIRIASLPLFISMLSIKFAYIIFHGIFLSSPYPQQPWPPLKELLDHKHLPCCNVKIFTRPSDSCRIVLTASRFFPNHSLLNFRYRRITYGFITPVFPTFRSIIMVIVVYPLSSLGKFTLSQLMDKSIMP